MKEGRGKRSEGRRREEEKGERGRNTYLIQKRYESDRVFPIAGFEYLRLSGDLLQPDNLQAFATFVQNMHTLE